MLELIAKQSEQQQQPPHTQKPHNNTDEVLPPWTCKKLDTAKQRIDELEDRSKETTNLNHKEQK